MAPFLVRSARRCWIEPARGRRRARPTGSRARRAFATRDPRANALNTRELFALYEKGAIRPRVSKTFTLEQSGEAIAWVAGRNALGKVLLIP